MIPLINRASDFNDGIAIRSNRREYSYQELLKKSADLAGFLMSDTQDLGEQPVAFMIPPSFEYTSVQWGIWRAGGVAVPLCVAHPLDSIQYVLEDTGCTVLITVAEYFEFLVPLTEALNIDLIKLEDIPTKSRKRQPDIDASRNAMILYTSGTTSLPKGVVTTHDNIDAQITTLVKAWQWSKDDAILNLLPLHHVHGIINVMSCALYSGATCEFLPKFDPASVWDIFRSGRINVFMAVPTIYFKLITYFEDCSKEQQVKMSNACRSFRLMVSGSAALPVSVLHKWKEISGHILLERYGMTEIGMALSNPYDGERRPGHVGLPLPGVEIRIANNADQKVDDGDQGEIQVKGRSVFKQYWKKVKATTESFTSDGWFRTGDIALLNEGYYKILGRNSVDIIKSGGYKISALEIEEKLRMYPGVKECAVVGLPDEEWGEVVAASLVANPDEVDIEVLKSWLSEKLPGYKIPRKYIFQKNLPRNTLGKVTKNELKKYFD